ALPRAGGGPLGCAAHRSPVGARERPGQGHRRDGPDPDQRPASGRAGERVLLHAGAGPRLQPLVAVLDPPVAAAAARGPRRGRPRARPARLMGFLDSLLGRSKPVKSNLDDLFGLPTAALTLQAAMGLTGTGAG